MCYDDEPTCDDIYDVYGCLRAYDKAQKEQHDRIIYHRDEFHRAVEMAMQAFALGKMDQTHYNVVMEHLCKIREALKETAERKVFFQRFFGAMEMETKKRNALRDAAKQKLTPEERDAVGL